MLLIDSAHSVFEFGCGTATFRSPIARISTRRRTLCGARYQDQNGLTGATWSEALAGTCACLPITSLALSLLVLFAVVVFGSWYAPAFGDAGLRLQHYLLQPLFSLGGLPIAFFLFSQSRYLLLLWCWSSRLISRCSCCRREFLPHMPIGSGQQYTVARVISYLVFILGWSVCNTPRKRGRKTLLCEPFSMERTILQ